MATVQPIGQFGNTPPLGTKLKQPGNSRTPDSDRDIARTIRTIREFPSLFIAFSIYRMIAVSLLTGLVFFNTPFNVLGVATTLSAAPATLWLLFCCAIIFTILAFCTRMIHPSGRPLITWIATALLIAGLIFTKVFEQNYLTLLAGSLLAASGFCIIHIELGRVAGYLGTSKTLMFGAVSSLVGIALFAFMYVLPGPVDTICTSVCLACLALALEHAKSRIGRARLFAEHNVELHIPYRFIITSFTQGITIGVACTLLHMAADTAAFVNTIATVGAAIAAFVTVIVMKVNYDRSIYRIGFLAMGVGMILYSVTNGPLGRFIALLIQNCAFIYLDLVLWSFGSYLIKHLKQPAIWATCCPTGALMGGRFAGTIIGYMILNDDATEGLLALTPSDVAAILSFCIVAAALLLSSTRNVQSGWGFIRPGAPEDTAPASHELACQLIAADYSLTGREAEVLYLLAQGKTRREIAEGLCVSDNTVKTHVRSIYAKLDVHSREELTQRILSSERPFEIHE